MLFSARATQPEHFDDARRTPAEFRAAYAELARVNRLFRAEDPYTRIMARWLGAEECRKLSILDLGAGDGWLGHAMESWATERGWSWKVTNLDLNPVPLSLSHGRSRVAASVLNLPFEDGAFDVVIASQMTHHLNTDDDVVRHFQEAWRVASRAIFITDMHRGWFLYLLLRVALPLLRLSPAMKHDGFLSVRKAWRTAEWRRLAERARLESARISGYFGTRVILSARKSPVSSVQATETSESYRGADGFYSAPFGR